jgi:hypothetical protein
MNTLRQYKHAVLLVALVWVSLIESFSHRRMLGPVLSDLALGTTLLLVFLIVFEHRLSRLVAFMALATAVSIIAARAGLPPGAAEVPLRIVYHSATLLLSGFAAIVILHHIFARGVVCTDDVLGGVCGYLLAAGAWANLFMLIETFSPGAFSVGPGVDATLDTWHGCIAALSYVSLGSLTGVGSGAVVPVHPPATVLTTLEAVFGQFYMAVVVAQLVGAWLSQASQRISSPQA